MKFFKILIGCVAILLGIGAIALGALNIVNKNWSGAFAVLFGVILLLAGIGLIKNRSLQDFFESIFTNSVF